MQELRRLLEHLATPPPPQWEGSLKERGNRGGRGSDREGQKETVAFPSALFLSDIRCALERGGGGTRASERASAHALLCLLYLEVVGAVAQASGAGLGARRLAAPVHAAHTHRAGVHAQTTTVSTAPASGARKKPQFPGTTSERARPRPLGLRARSAAASDFRPLHHRARFLEELPNCSKLVFKTNPKKLKQQTIKYFFASKNWLKNSI